MAISGVPSSNLANVQRLLAEIGRFIDAESEKGMRISDGEAQKILDQVAKLPENERKQVQADLKALLINDFFTVTPEARKKFAQAFGVKPRELEPRERAELVGLASARSAFQAGVQALAKTPRMDKKTMVSLVSGAETYLDKPGQAFLAGVLRNASRDGFLKLDTDARKVFTKWMAGLDQDQAVTHWTKQFDLPGAGNVDYLSSLMASGMCFEDLVAAFMMHVAGQLQKESVEKMREIERNERLIQEQEQKKESKLNDLFKSRGLDKPEGAEAPAEPKAAEPSATGAAQGPDPEYAKRTKKNLEAVVQSVHSHMSEQDKDSPGVIDAREAKMISEKLARLEPPVSKLIARAMVNTLRATPGVYLESDTFKPLADWARSELGQDIDLSPLPRRKAGEAEHPLAKQLRESDKLEDKIASFMVDALLSSDKTLKEKMQDLKALTQDMAQDPASKAAYEQVIQPHEGSAKALKEAAARKAAAKAGAAGEAAQLSEAAAGPGAEAQAAEGPEPKSRQILWEELKNLQNQLAQIMQALSNILNAMHQNAMNSIRAIR